MYNAYAERFMILKRAFLNNNNIYCWCMFYFFFVVKEKKINSIRKRRRYLGLVVSGESIIWWNLNLHLWAIVQQRKKKKKKEKWREFLFFLFDRLDNIFYPFFFLTFLYCQIIFVTWLDLFFYVIGSVFLFYY